MSSIAPRSPRLGSKNGGSQPSRRRCRTEWRRNGSCESNGEACATDSRVPNSSGNEKHNLLQPKSVALGAALKEKLKEARARLGRKHRGRKMDARSACREGTRINGGLHWRWQSWTVGGGKARPGIQKTQERGTDESETSRAKEQGVRPQVKKWQRTAAPTRTWREKTNPSEVAGTKPGALLHSGLIMMHRHLGRQVEVCESVNAVQAKGIAAAYLLTALKPNAGEQARDQKHSRIAVFSRSRGFADVWSSGESRRRADPEIPCSRSIGSGGRRMVTRSSSRIAARCRSVDSVIWSPGTYVQSRARLDYLRLSQSLRTRSPREKESPRRKNGSRPATIVGGTDSKKNIPEQIARGSGRKEK